MDTKGERCIQLTHLYGHLFYGSMLERVQQIICRWSCCVMATVVRAATTLCKGFTAAYRRAKIWVCLFPLWMLDLQVETMRANIRGDSTAISVDQHVCNVVKVSLMILLSEKGPRSVRLRCEEVCMPLPQRSKCSTLEDKVLFHCQQHHCYIKSTKPTMTWCITYQARYA